jgi:ribosomal protein S18 acetylase RimI-like enzyme
VIVRPARHDPHDEQFLWLMLAEAAGWRGGAPRTPRGELQTNPDFARYVAGWGREGDSGVIAEVDGRPAGAAWARRFDAADHGYGFIDPAVPELSLAVAPAMRRRGIASALLAALIEGARRDGLGALSLSVEEDNPAVDLYRRFGFEPVGRVENAWTMVARLLDT